MTLFALILIVAPLLAGAFLLALRSGMRNSALLALAVAPVVGIYAWSDHLRAVASHGFLHTSIVYEILRTGLPPECPVMAGEVLLYPWGHHLVAAGLVALLGFSPALAFAALNVTALTLSVWLMFLNGQRLAGDRLAGIFAAALSVFGVTFFNYRGLWAPVARFTGWEGFTLRNIVVVNKFTTFQNNAMGFLFFALFLFAMLRLFDRERERHGVDYVLLALAVLGAGFFYPITWLALGASGGGVLALLFLRHGAPVLPTLLRTAAVMAGCALAVAPYLVVTAAGKSQQMFLLAPDLGFLATKLVGWVMTFSPVGLVIYWKREVLLRIARERGDLLGVAVAPLLTTGLLYVVVATDWNQNEYKFFNLSSFSMGLLASSAMAAVYRSHKLLCFVLMTAFFLPLSSDWMSKTYRGNFPITDEFFYEGRYLRHVEQNEDALYRWIEVETSPAAVFVDTRLTVPSFGRRRLYVGLDDRMEGVDVRRLKNGWQIRADVIMDRYFAYAPELIEWRRRVTRTIFGVPGPLPDAAAADLRRVAGEAGFYAISRREESTSVLESNPDFEKVFSSGPATVFALRPASSG